MRAIDQERWLLLSCMQDQAEAATCTSSRPVPEAAVPNPASNSRSAPQGEASMPTGNNASAAAAKHSHAPDAAAGTQCLHASLLAEEHLTLQRSVSGGTMLPGSLRQRVVLSVPAQHASSACSAWRVQPSPLKSEGSHTASSLRRWETMGAASAAQREQGAAGVTAQAEPSIETHSASQADGARKVENTVATSGSSTLYQHASLPTATSNGWHLRASNQAGAVTRRRHSGYAELQAYSQKKEALCPTIKNCIQEVLQLRAQLSVDSLQLGSSLE